MQSSTRALGALLVFLLVPARAGAEGGHHLFEKRPDAHAPIGVMGDHMHHAGEFMLSYRFARMRMDGNRDRTANQTDGDVLRDGFMATPTDMDTNVHMFGLMYAPTDWVTLMAMLPYVEKQMDHVTAMGGSFNTESDGIGDFKFGSMWRLFENENHHVHLNLGASFPTGGIRHSDRTPGPGGLANNTLPFPMQIGSGTYDVMPGMTYMGHASWLSWGLQSIGTIRSGKNEAGWRMGHRADTTAWVARPWTEWMSTSFRAQYSWWGNYAGDENRPPPRTAIPTADPDRRAGHRIDLLPGVNFIVPLGPLRKHRFGIEAGFPVYQWLDGPQLELDWRVVAGWQFAF